MTGLPKLRTFVAEVAQIVDAKLDESATLARLAPKLKELVTADDWLPDAYAAADGKAYRQYLLYADPLDRFSIVSFVWGPGQGTPIHDHRVWGLVGVLRGEELSVSYARQPDGSLRPGPTERLAKGTVAAVSPDIGDIHAISNGLADKSSISIHVYGGNIGRIHRSVFDATTGAEHEFVSGYSNEFVPNLWV
ncbi:cysteine dioxygenase [Bradyrhizobium sp. INPA01-394B]|uniref:Cysteine dioxygenase n=1 Tax=Bradyrhizobium campsiandrae TaxID=1729892 RepID=A0ABR7U8W2_9BRAD|nr:cysteine dioxygenase [Bradyrhizobium campsiandrae]MBC9876601.1 cysteine dioxygenase [Bradyrhizobium campsiandrae]MBC9979857.1 cysteine dioxygenase [Bradyrhizobium campsiandrae]